jgi:hypothetical protein
VEEPQALTDAEFDAALVELLEDEGEGPRGSDDDQR